MNGDRSIINIMPRCRDGAIANASPIPVRLGPHGGRPLLDALLAQRLQGRGDDNHLRRGRERPAALGAVQALEQSNPEKKWRLQPFGGYLDDFHFEGNTLPTKVEAGNHFGTEAYVPFFQVRVGEVQFSAW